MKLADVEILIIPGYKNSGPGHWQSRWQRKMRNARRVEQVEWQKPVRSDWVAKVRDEIANARKPVVAIAHSLGVASLVHAVNEAEGTNPVHGAVAGAFLVAPPEVTNSNIRPKHLMTFGPYPENPLPFPSFTIASRNDPFGSFEATETAAAAWGSFLIDAGDAGHIDEASGHGPWPEGMMVLAQLISRL